MGFISKKKLWTLLWSLKNPTKINNTTNELKKINTLSKEKTQNAREKQWKETHPWCSRAWCLNFDLHMPRKGGEVPYHNNNIKSCANRYLKINNNTRNDMRKNKKHDKSRGNNVRRRRQHCENENAIAQEEEAIMKKEQRQQCKKNKAIVRKE